VAVGRIERRARRPPAAVEAVDDVVRDAVALLLAREDLTRKLRPLGVVLEQLTQQSGRPLYVLCGGVDEVEEPRVVSPQGHRSRRP
jgi:hypothetical protein